MSLRSDLLPVFNGARSLIANDLDFRRHRVIQRTKLWSADEVGLGGLVTTDLELLPKPKVTQVGPGTVLVDKITPKYAAGGYTIAELQPRDLQDGEEQVWILIGPDGVEREYQLVAIDARRNFGYSLTLQSLTREDPHP